MKKLNLFLYFALMSWGIRAIALNPPPGQIIDTHAHKQISKEALLKALSSANIVLIGEQHDIAIHHDIENWLLKATSSTRRKGSVLFEMIDNKQQQLISTVQRWLLNGGYSGKYNLSDKIGWNYKWDWSQYENIINTAMRSPAQVLAASPPLSLVYQHQSFKPVGPNASSPTVRQALSLIIKSDHMDSQKMVAMQQYKDNYMAEAIMKAPKPAWLIAGAIHTSYLLGIPLYLKDNNYTGIIKVLIMTNDPSIDPRHADYIWLLKNDAQ